MRRRLERIIILTGIKARPLRVLIGFCSNFWFFLLEPVWQDRQENTERRSSRHTPTGEQLEIPSPPKKNSSPYATIAVCLVGERTITTGLYSGHSSFLWADFLIADCSSLSLCNSIKTRTPVLYFKKMSGDFQDIVQQLFYYVSFLTSQRSHIIENSLYQCFITIVGL